MRPQLAPHEHVCAMSTAANNCRRKPIKNQSSSLVCSGRVLTYAPCQLLLRAAMVAIGSTYLGRYAFPPISSYQIQPSCTILHRVTKRTCRLPQYCGTTTRTSVTSDMPRCVPRYCTTVKLVWAIQTWQFVHVIYQLNPVDSSSRVSHIVSSVSFKIFEAHHMFGPRRPLTTGT